MPIELCKRGCDSARRNCGYIDTLEYHTQQERPTHFYGQVS